MTIKTETKETMTENNKECQCWPRCHLVKQGSCCKLRNKGWGDKLATGTNTNSYPAEIKVAKQELKIGIWNLCMLRVTGKLEFQCKQIQPYNYNILRLAEPHWTGKGDIKGGEVIWSGKVTECR